MVLRRRPARIVVGQPEGGYTSMYGIISCHRGDHPGPDHREVPSVASRAASRTRRVMISRNSRAYLRACMFRSLPVRESVRSQAGL